MHGSNSVKMLRLLRSLAQQSELSEMQGIAGAFSRQKQKFAATTTNGRFGAVSGRSATGANAI